MLDSIGRRLLRKLRGGPNPSPAPGLDPPHALDLDRSPLLAAIDEARTGGPTAVDRLSSLLIEVDRAENPDLEGLAVSLLAEADPVLWKNLDLATRRTWWGVPDWAKIARERISQGETSALALVVASFHPVGFVREAAVARLGEIDDEVALPALALRTGDWVPQVRDCARAALVQRLSSSVQSLLGVGPVAVMLADRAQGRWLFTQLEEATTALNDTDLRQLLDAPDWRLRRVTYSVALRDGRLDRADLLRAAERDGDLVIRVQMRRRRDPLRRRGLQGRRRPAPDRQRHGRGARRRDICTLAGR